MAVRKQDTPFYFPSMPSVQTLYVLSLLANKRTYCTELRKPVLRRLLLNTSSQFVLLLLLLLLHLPRSQLLLVWEPCTLPHTRQSPPAPTLVLHAANAAAAAASTGRKHARSMAHSGNTPTPKAPMTRLRAFQQDCSASAEEEPQPSYGHHDPYDEAYGGDVGSEDEEEEWGDLEGRSGA